MVSLKINIKETVILIVLISLTLFFTVYTASAYSVASHIQEYDGRFIWPHMPPGSFVPWPTYTDFGFTVIVDATEVDIWYFNNIIKSNVLVFGTFLLWAVVSWRIWKLWKQNKVV